MNQIFSDLLLMIGLCPIIYWTTRIVWNFVLYKLDPPHHVTIEYINEDGLVERCSVDVGKDRKFYQAVTKALAKSQKMGSRTP